MKQLKPREGKKTMKGPHSESMSADHLRVFYRPDLGFPRNKEYREGEIIQQNFRSNSFLSPNHTDTTTCFFQIVICYFGGRLELPRINFWFINRNLTHFYMLMNIPYFILNKFIFSKINVGLWQGTSVI